MPINTGLCTLFGRVSRVSGGCHTFSVEGRVENYAFVFVFVIVNKFSREFVAIEGCLHFI